MNSNWKSCPYEIQNSPAKTGCRTWEMLLAPQLIHLLFVKASSEMVSMETYARTWLKISDNRSHGVMNPNMKFFVKQYSIKGNWGKGYNSAICVFYRWPSVYSHLQSTVAALLWFWAAYQPVVMEMLSKSIELWMKKSNSRFWFTVPQYLCFVESV